MTDEQERDVTDELGLDSLDDEAPPEIPDIAFESAAAALSENPDDAEEIEPEPASQPPSEVRRLAPPPKPPPRPPPVSRDGARPPLGSQPPGNSAELAQVAVAQPAPVLDETAEGPPGNPPRSPPPARLGSDPPRLDPDSMGKRAVAPSKVFAPPRVTIDPNRTPSEPAPKKSDRPRAETASTKPDLTSSRPAPPNQHLPTPLPTRLPTPPPVPTMITPLPAVPATPPAQPAAALQSAIAAPGQDVQEYEDPASWDTDDEEPPTPPPIEAPRRQPISVLEDAAPPEPADRRQATAIMAMRIIAIGDALPSDRPPPPPSAEQPAAEMFEQPLPVRQSARSAAAASVSDAAAEELSEEDVSPDSEELPVAFEEPEAVEESEAVEEPEALEEPDAVSELQLDAKGRRPPPPPRRQTPSTAPERSDLAAPQEPEKLDEGPRTRQRRPWWEELFSEDFVRATRRLSEPQVTREVDFIEESLGVAAGGVVLDLACGAGYHAVELASRGYGVVGYDLSLYQLALAADVAQDRDQKLNFLQGDMREMAFEEMFDGIYCWNTSFGYFEEEKNQDVAQRVFRALRPGGMLLLDVVNRDFVVEHAPSQVWYEGDACVCMDDMSVDFIHSRLRVKRSLIMDDGRTRECSYSLRLYSLHELGRLLHDVGFRVTEASGHPTTPGVYFGQCSPRIIILAQRP